MRIFHITEEKDPGIVTGTNCSNCEYIKGSKPAKIEKGEMNAQGGIEPKTDEEMRLAQEGDLITLPGQEAAEAKLMCNHPKIKQFVTNRMCCAYWDNPGVYRPYKDSNLKVSR